MILLALFFIHQWPSTTPVSTHPTTVLFLSLSFVSFILLFFFLSLTISHSHSLTHSPQKIPHFFFRLHFSFALFIKNLKTFKNLSPPFTFSARVLIFRQCWASTSVFEEFLSASISFPWKKSWKWHWKWGKTFLCCSSLSFSFLVVCVLLLLLPHLLVSTYTYTLYVHVLLHKLCILSSRIFSHLICANVSFFFYFGQESLMGFSRTHFPCWWNGFYRSRPQLKLVKIGFGLDAFFSNSSWNLLFSNLFVVLLI